MLNSTMIKFALQSNIEPVIVVSITQMIMFSKPVITGTQSDYYFLQTLLIDGFETTFGSNKVNSVPIYYTLVCICLNNYDFQRIESNNFVYTKCMDNIVCFDSLKAIIVQTNANYCIVHGITPKYLYNGLSVRFAAPIVYYIEPQVVQCLCLEVTPVKELPQIEHLTDANSCQSFHVFGGRLEVTLDWWPQRANIFDGQRYLHIDRSIVRVGRIGYSSASGLADRDLRQNVVYKCQIIL